MSQKKPASSISADGAGAMKINYEEIRKLIALLEEKNLSHFELELEEFKIKISRSIPSALPDSPVQVSAAPSETVENPALVHAHAHEYDPSWALIKSPMVGTFYRAPDPTADSFVEVGDTVKKGQTLCIIEAMKLMNEIEADTDGTIAEIFAENAKPVEYGQKLFAIQPPS